MSLIQTNLIFLTKHHFLSLEVSVWPKECFSRDVGAVEPQIISTKPQNLRLVNV